MKDFEDCIAVLKSQANPDNVAGMARYGISVDKAFGVSLPIIRALAKKYKNNHALALQLWQSGYHEARILATMVENPNEVTEAQMELWVADFDSWDVCDQCCSNLFDKTPFAEDKAFAWAMRDQEYVKRAGFVMMACLAVHSKTLKDVVFMVFLLYIAACSEDSRNFVRKAVNWALRQIGKRNQELHEKALLLCQVLVASENKNAQWIGKDALKELMGATAINRMMAKDKMLKAYNSKLIERSS